MRRAEFDRFAEEYRQTHSGVLRRYGDAPEYFAEYKVRDLLSLLKRDRKGGFKPRVLDFGAGIGSAIPHIAKYLPEAEIVCLDVSMESLAIGVQRFGDSAQFVAFDGQTLPFSDGCFDAVMAACVFHHIPPRAHQGLLRELRRVLRQDGVAMIYEHNPLNPLTRRVVQLCPFDEEAILIPSSTMRDSFVRAGFDEPRVRFRVFFPRQLSTLRPLERLLTWLPMGAQYYVTATKK